MRLLKGFELLLYLVAFSFGAYRAIQEVSVALTERAPTPLRAEDFPDRYQGQQWVRVRGRLAVEHMHVRPSRYQAHEGKDWAYFTVPVVPLRWDGGPVHVLATFGPEPRRSAADWARANADRPEVTGQLRPDAMRDPAGMFPGLDISPAVVVVNDGTAPKHAPVMVLFLLMMTGAAWLMVVRLRSLWRDRREELTVDDL